MCTKAKPCGVLRQVAAAATASTGSHGVLKLLLLTSLLLLLLLRPCFGCAEGSYDGEEAGQGEFDSFVEPAGLILSSFIEKHLMEGGGPCRCCCRCS
jgi:hypothetical protein